MLRVLRPAFAVAAGLLACALGAQPAPTTSDSTSGAPKKKLSGDIAASVTAGLPKFEPPKPADEKAKAEQAKDAATESAEPVDLRDVDKPKNEIIRLPKYIVEGYRPPILRERDIYTERGLGALAMQRYLSSLDRNVLNRFTIPLFGTSAQARALAMYAEEERLRNMAEFSGHAQNAAIAGDTAGSEYIKQKSDETFMRRSDFGWSNSNK